jgi:hypothetical protein
MSKETQKRMNVLARPFQRMRIGILAALIASVALLVAIAAPAAQAEFGFKHFDVEYTNEDGTPATQAGSHPYAVTASFELNWEYAG